MEITIRKKQDSECGYYKDCLLGGGGGGFAFINLFTDKILRHQRQIKCKHF